MASTDATARRARRQEYVGALGADAATRADALGLDHAGDCSDADPADDRLRCWRCWFIDTCRAETDEEGDHDA